MLEPTTRTARELCSATPHSIAAPLLWRRVARPRGAVGAGRCGPPAWWVAAGAHRGSGATALLRQTPASERARSPQSGPARGGTIRGPSEAAHPVERAWGLL